MDAIRALFRWYLVEVATVFAVLAVVAGQSHDRLFWISMALMGAVLLTFKYGGNRTGTRVVRGMLALLAIGLAMGGVVMVGAGVFLMVQGSFGFLAGLVLIPAGLGIMVGGWTAFRLARTRQTVPWSETGFGRLERGAPLVEAVVPPWQEKPQPQGNQVRAKNP